MTLISYRFRGSQWVINLALAELCSRREVYTLGNFMALALNALKLKTSLLGIAM